GLWEQPGLEFFRAVHEAFKQADPQRLTISAGDPGPGHLDVATEKGGSVDKPLAANGTDQFVDVLGIHLYLGWYSGKAGDVASILDRNKAERRPKLYMSTEVGAEGILGQRSLVMHPWTEDYQ